MNDSSPGNAALAVRPPRPWRAHAARRHRRHLQRGAARRGGLRRRSRERPRLPRHPRRLAGPAQGNRRRSVRRHADGRDQQVQARQDDERRRSDRSRPGPHRRRGVRGRTGDRGPPLHAADVMERHRTHRARRRPDRQPHRRAGDGTRLDPAARRAGRSRALPDRAPPRRSRTCRHGAARAGLDPGRARRDPGDRHRRHQRAGRHRRAQCRQARRRRRRRRLEAGALAAPRRRARPATRRSTGSPTWSAS